MTKIEGHRIGVFLRDCVVSNGMYCSGGLRERSIVAAPGAIVARTVFELARKSCTDNVDIRIVRS